MNWILVTLVVLILIFLYNNHKKKRKTKQVRKQFLEYWGKPKARSIFDFSLIEKYFRNTLHKEKAFHVISDKTVADLDLHELFKYIDRTVSKIGQQYLYFKLRTITSIKDLIRSDELSRYFIQNKSLRIRSQMLLSELSSHSAYDLENLLHGPQIEKSKHIKKVHGLNMAMLLCVSLGFWNSIFFFGIIPIYMINAYLHIRSKQKVGYYLSGVKQLSKALRISRSLLLHDELKNHYKDVSFIKKIENIKLKTEFLGFETHLLNNEYFLAIWMVLEGFKIFFNIEYLVFNSFIEDVTNEKESIENLFLFLGEIDVAICVASLKSGEMQLCVPEFSDEKEMKFLELKHPLIENCVSNDLNIKDKNVLITGSNMSGKTTFIRAVAVNSILAQTLHVCFAKSYKAPFVKLYSSIRIADNIQEHTSYFLAEVLTVKELVNQAKDVAPCLFILDEIFKGTNTIERISGGKGILSYLGKGNNIVLVSTHDIELTEMLSVDKYELFHFCEQIIGKTLTFDHKIRHGKLKTRNAIKILELYGFPSEIIQEAEAVKTNFSA